MWIIRSFHFSSFEMNKLVQKYYQTLAGDDYFEQSNSLKLCIDHNTGIGQL